MFIIFDRKKAVTPFSYVFARSDTAKKGEKMEKAIKQRALTLEAKRVALFVPSSFACETLLGGARQPI